MFPDAKYIQANLIGAFNLSYQIQQTFGWIDGEAGVIMGCCETINSNLHVMGIEARLLKDSRSF
jgi:hypothetical protein